MITRSQHPHIFSFFGLLLVVGLYPKDVLHAADKPEKVIAKTSQYLKHLRIRQVTLSPHQVARLVEGRLMFLPGQRIDAQRVLMQKPDQITWDKQQCQLSLLGKKEGKIVTLKIQMRGATIDTPFIRNQSTSTVITAQIKVSQSKWRVATLLWDDISLGAGFKVFEKTCAPAKPLKSTTPDVQPTKSRSSTIILKPIFD